MVETVLHIQYALEGSHPRPLCLSYLNCGKDGRTRPQDAPLRIEEDRLVLIDSEAESLRGLARLNALEWGSGLCSGGYELPSYRVVWTADRRHAARDEDLPA
jgi:hypothetical protein